MYIKVRFSKLKVVKNCNCKKYFKVFMYKRRTSNLIYMYEVKLKYKLKYFNGTFNTTFETLIVYQPDENIS